MNESGVGVRRERASHCEKQPPSNFIRPEPCERHRREMVRRGDGP